MQNIEESPKTVSMHSRMLAALIRKRANNRQRSACNPAASTDPCASRSVISVHDFTCSTAGVLRNDNNNYPVINCPSFFEVALSLPSLDAIHADSLHLCPSCPCGDQEANSHRTCGTDALRTTASHGITWSVAVLE